MFILAMYQPASFIIKYYRIKEQTFNNVKSYHLKRLKSFKLLMGKLDKKEREIKGTKFIKMEVK